MASARPGMQSKRLEQHRQELELELLRARVDKLRLPPVVRVPPKPRRFRTKVFEWLFGGGALVAALTIGLDYTGGREGGDTTRHVQVCERAHAAITDDAYNKLLTPAEAQKFKAQQLQIVERCNKDIEL